MEREAYEKLGQFYLGKEYDIADRERTEDLLLYDCLLYTSPSPRDATLSRMPSSA